MASRKEFYSHFHTWLDDFEKTDAYTNIVGNYEKCWIKIYKELQRIFTDTVWNEMKKEDDRPPRIDDDQKDNYKKQFDAWLREFQKTREYLSVVTGCNEDCSKIYCALHRIFKYTVWDALKIIGNPTERECYCQYNFPYDDI